MLSLSAVSVRVCVRDARLLSLLHHHPSSRHHPHASHFNQHTTLHHAPPPPNHHHQVKRRMEEEEKGLRARKRMSSPELWEARQLINSGECLRACVRALRWLDGEGRDREAIGR